MKNKPKTTLDAPQDHQSETAALVSLSTEQRMTILKAISDPRRMEILERLSSCTNCVACSDMRECLPISAATLSHHLKELEAAGLILIVREGKYANLTLRRNVWDNFLADLKRI